MDVPLTADQQTRLSRMAAAQGCDEKVLVQEAVERGELVEHDDVRRLIERRYPA
ncbi:MAG: hypothetical protein IT162_12490 [Bryobacterales bacterium]|nr:hypothetical protein [Bryobacterales bacterium]